LNATIVFDVLGAEIKNVWPPVDTVLAFTKAVLPDRLTVPVVVDVVGVVNAA
jgi:hypothetical protein